MLNGYCLFCPNPWDSSPHCRDTCGAVTVIWAKRWIDDVAIPIARPTLPAENPKLGQVGEIALDR